jgi:hypothetical protein
MKIRVSPRATEQVRAVALCVLRVPVRPAPSSRACSLELLSRPRTAPRTARTPMNTAAARCQRRAEFGPERGL